MLRSSLARPVAAVLLAGASLLAAAPAGAVAQAGAVGSAGAAASGPRADDTMPGMDHGSMPGTGHGATSVPREGHAPASGSAERPRALVLALFAGVNGAVMAAAAVVRRRTAGRRQGGRPRRAGTAAA